MLITQGVKVFGQVLFWGAVAGIVHFVFYGLAYGNPLVDRMYTAAAGTDPAVRMWPSRPRYLLTQLLGTQVEVYLLTLGFVWLRPLIGAQGLACSVLLGGLFAAVRVYPRFWNMWIQTTYPRRLLAVEFVNGVLGTFVIVLTVHVLMSM